MRAYLVLIAIVCDFAWLEARADDRIDFAHDIQPLLTEHCTRCHGGVLRAGGLLLLPGGGLPAAGDSGLSPLMPGKPENSELLRRLTSHDPDERMPAKGRPLSPNEIAKIRRWIEEGAEWPAHWSLQRVPLVSLPSVSDVAWTRTPLDRFIRARLEENRIDPSPAADRYTLIRRLSLDLLGLQPTPAEADAFVAALPPDAYERLVDRLLASPHFGERWGRHWLDLARFADSDGYEVDKPRPDAFRWRDWVIEAVNRDVPFDEFTLWQFAGDLLPDADPHSRLATAFHRQTLTNNEGGVDKEEYRLKAVLDRVSNMGTVWLGLTLACAQCHDHPYDPFTQREFFALAAIFNNAEEAEIELLESAARKPPLKFRVLAERDTPRQTRLLKRGDYLQPGDEISPALPTSLVAQSKIQQLPDPDKSDLRPLEPPLSPHRPTRLDLAHWLVDAANPLTARVAANHIWLRLMGRGLVRTPEDFGARGRLPAHPQLLDWTAGEFVHRGWSRKSLIREIVSSATYRQSSRQRDELEAADPLNLLLARQNRSRVEAEIVRDVHLNAGGLLSSKVGGPSVFPPLGTEFVKITFRSELPWRASNGEDRYRRGMYTFFKRSVPYPDLVTFDCPDASAAAAQRGVSNTPLQALTLLNSETCVEAAHGLAGRLLTQPSISDEAIVQTAFRTCLTRPPDSAERARLMNVLHDHRVWYESHPEEAQLVVLNVQRGHYTQAHAAAVVATINVLLNLDEFITRE